MTTKRPSFLRRVVKFFVFLFFLGVVLLAGVAGWAVWPQAVIPAENFARLSPHGAFFVRFDPRDPETASLIRGLASPGEEAASSFAMRLATSAIHPELAVLSFYDRATGTESFAAAVQLRRLGRPFAMVLGMAADSPNADIARVGNGVFSIPNARRGADEPFVRFMREGIIVASLDSAADRLGRFVGRGTADGAPRPTDQMRELYGRMLVEPGQLRGFLANDDQRIARLLARLDSEGALEPEALEVLTPEVRQALEQEVSGLLVAGELLADDRLEARVRLLFASADSAERLEPVFAAFLLPKLREEYPGATFELERERATVTVRATIDGIREKIRAAQRGG